MTHPSTPNPSLPDPLVQSPRQRLHPPLPRPRPWRFWVPLLIQTALILTIPLQVMYTYTTGKTVVLQTAPVDPYNLFRGYYVTLGYDISTVANLEKLPGGKQVFAQPARSTDAATPPPSLFETGEPFYVILEAPPNPETQPPAPWKPVAVRRDRPTNLPPNQVVLRGNQREGWLTYGLERYYIPEDKRFQINTQIDQLQRQSQRPPFVVEVKVNGQGQAIPVSIWLENQQYQF